MTLLKCDWQGQEGSTFRLQNSIAVLLWLRHVSEEIPREGLDGSAAGGILGA